MWTACYGGHCICSQAARHSYLSQGKKRRENVSPSTKMHTSSSLLTCQAGGHSARSSSCTLRMHGTKTHCFGTSNGGPRQNFRPCVWLRWHVCGCIAGPCEERREALEATLKGIAAHCTASEAVPQVPGRGVRLFSYAIAAMRALAPVYDCQAGPQLLLQLFKAGYFTLH